MSSFASPNTFEFSTVTTSFTADDKSGLPSYSEVFASAPLLNDTLTPSIFGTSSSLTFQYDSSGSYGYSFLVRDAFGCLQAKGEVDNYNAKLQSVNGMEMLKITKRNEETGVGVRTFEIRHKNKNIGTVKVAENDPASTCLRIIHNNAYPEIIVRSLKIGDFAIYRPNSMSSPICNIQMPHAEVYIKNNFSGTIIFHPETGVTTEEQLLCTAAAIAFKVTLNRKTTDDDSETKMIGYCLGIVVSVLIIVIFVALFNYMEKQSCERRKAAGYSGYVNNPC